MSKITFIYPNLQRVPAINIGLAYLISSAEKKHKVSLIDLTFHSQDYQRYLTDKLKENPPEAVGISVTSITFPGGLQIASLVKQLYPDIPIIFGGVHPTLLPEETLANPEIDAVCIGEGEESILGYLDCLEKHLLPRDVAGIWYKDNGKIIKNPLRPFKEDLDSFPYPNWDYWEIDKYLDTSGYFFGCLPLITTRGCIYNCTFCADPSIRKTIPGVYYRLRSPQNIIQEIKVNKQKYKEKFRSLTIFDETFGLNKKQLADFCKLYIEEGLHKKIIWSCGTRAEIVTSEWAKTVAEAGCGLVGFGIESGDDNIREKIYGKNITYQQIKDATRCLRENKVMYFFNFIIDGPGDSKENIRKSRKLVAELNPVDTIYHFYQPLPQTELYERVIKEIPVDRVSLYTSAFIKFWDIPREHAFYLRKKDLKKIMWQIRIDTIFRFFKQGFKVKGFHFILDVIKYIMNVGGQRTIPLRNPYVRVALMRKTIYRYVQDYIYQSQFTAGSHP